ncbi:hypothetical protein CXB51_004865 [Gossypium anomalum]|uniref:DUF7745 domain-containing protein n=1 Tax=Gossypium anomalum TaxID=47600 RepID=A0A8J5ZF47_9ROSI|nr:hypothetical protein CXB51_004865 [Gossypium anomalum]
MTVVVTPLGGSEKLRFREVFASVQDSGSLSGYIRTYGIDSRSISKLESFVMENRLLDRVEGNANVHRWSEQTQLERGDSIAARYMSELSDYTRISVDEHLFRALAQFWNPAYSCFTFGEVDMEKGECKCISWDALKDLILTHPDETKKVDVFALSLYGLMVFPRALGYVDEATTDLFHRLSKKVTSIPTILAETFRSLGACRRAGAGKFIGCAQLLLAWLYSHFRLIDRVAYQVFFEDYSPLKDIVASTRRVDVPEENWIALLQNLQSKDVEWRASWMMPGEVLYRCGSFDWVPLLGIWGAIGYAPLLVLRQHGLRQFVPTTQGLDQSEFVYRGSDYKKRVSEISSAWKKTCRLKGVAEFERKNLEFEKRIAKLEEENMYLSLDVEVQKMEVEKERKEKRKIEEDRDDLKEHYKRAQKEVQEEKARAEYWERKFQEMQVQNLALEEENKGLKTKVIELGRSLRWHQNHNSTVELKELKNKVEDLEVALHDGELRVEQLKAQEDYLKGELHQDLAIRADVLSLMYSSSSDVGRELALLLDRVKALGLRAKAYL